MPSEQHYPWIQYRKVVKRQAHRAAGAFAKERGITVKLGRTR